jgi:predicted dehydrogenase
MGGYGELYLRNLFNPHNAGDMRLIAAADPDPSRCSQLADVNAREIPVYPSLEALLAQAKPDLVVLATPPQVHAEQVILSLQHGCHVLCEKPAASNPQQVRQMIAARDQANKQVAIGYQWSFSPVILGMKKDAIAGRFGKPKRLGTSVYWPRDEQYYHRNRWAGRIRDDHGKLVLDSPVNNAASHFLHNMFFVLGPQLDQSDVPRSVQAELYRANPIENYDTAVIRCRTAAGADLLFIASHATRTQHPLRLSYEFEHAVVEHGGSAGDQLIARFHDGTTVDYGAPPNADTGEKLQSVCRSIRENQPVICGLEAAASQTLCMFAASESSQITSFPPEMVVTTGEAGNRARHVPHLEAMLTQCSDRFALPSELGFDWARPGAVKIPA